jgi:hypothetical protein
MNNGIGLAVYDCQEYKDFRYRLMEDDEVNDFNLRHRKSLLNDAFIYNEGNADLMRGLCDYLCRAINELHRKCLNVYKTARNSDVGGKITIIGNIMPTFPKSHPRFSDEEEEIVNSLCDSTYNPSINLMRGVFIQNEEDDCDESVLGMEGLFCSTEVWLCDQQVPRLLNHWLAHTNYALYDLLWVREYTFEIDVDIDGIRL